jgi:hypothetical protein
MMLIKKEKKLNKWTIGTSHTFSKSKSLCNWRSVSQSVSLGVEPPVGPLTIFYICVVWPLWLYSSWGALCDDRTGLSITVSLSLHNINSFSNNYNVQNIFHKIYILYKATCQSRLRESRLCLTFVTNAVTAAWSPEWS